MISIDLKDAYLHVPVHPTAVGTSGLLRMVRYISSRPSALASPQPTGIHQDHGSCVSHTSRLGCSDTPVSGRLVGPLLIQNGGPVGKGHGSEPISAAWHCRQSDQVASHPLLLSHVSADIHRSPSLRAFPSQEKVSTLRSQLAEFLSYRRQGVVAFWCQGVVFVCAPFNWCFVIGGASRTTPWWFPKSNRTSLCGSSTPTAFFRESLWMEVQHPDQLFWSDASDHRWGAHLHDQFVSGRWSVEERSLHRFTQTSSDPSGAPSFTPL